MRIFPRFYLLAVAMILCMVPFMSACGQLDATPEKHMVKAQDYLDQGELQAASIELRNALLKAPDMLEARWLLSKLSIEIGDGATAEKEIDQAVKLGLARHAALPVKARAIILQADFDRMLEETKYIASDMSNQDWAQIMGLRGQAYLGKFEPEPARAAFDEALEIDPACVEALVGMASLNGLQRKYAEARYWVQRALEADDTSDLAWSSLGDIELAEGNSEEAEAAFSKAIEFQHYVSMNLAKRAMARVRLGRYADADADLKVLANLPLGQHPYVSYVQGLSYFGQQKYADAAQAFDASYQVNPSSLPLLIYLATTNHVLGNLQQAELYAERANNLAPQSLAAKQTLGAVRISQSQLDQAKGLLQTSLRDHPDDPSIIRMLAVVAYLEGDTAKNVEYLQKVVALQPDSQSAINALNTARLLDGQSLDASIANGQAASPAEDEQFTRDLLFAIEAFKNQNYGQALERTRQLQERYPDRTEPINLMSAIYLATGQWDKARVELEKVLALDAGNLSAARNLAILEARDGNLERARKLLRPVVEALPQDEEAILLLADIESRMGDQADAIRVLEQALERNPQAPKVITNLAEIYFRDGRYPDVVNVSGKLGDEQFGKHPRLLELRGRAQMLSGNAPAAAGSFERLVQAVPDSAETRYVYADSLIKAGDRKRAQQELQRVVEMDPDHLPARLRQVQLLAESDERAQALDRITEIEKKYGEKPEILGLSGWLLMLDGDYAAAEARLAKANAQSPDSEQTGYLVKALWEQKKYDQAIQVMQDWLERYPRDLAVRLRLASAYLSLGKMTEARSTYATVVEYYPRFVPALNDLAFLLGEEGELEEAIGYAERAYELTPDEPPVLDTLGVLLLKKGDVRRGHGLLRKAAERSPKDMEIQLHLGEALVQRKQYDEARQVLNGIVTTGPDSQSAAAAKALLKSMPR